jgi:hypothetical protein
MKFIANDPALSEVVYSDPLGGGNRMRPDAACVVGQFASHKAWPSALW